jgi:hypothetical protein
MRFTSFARYSKSNAMEGNEDPVNVEATELSLNQSVDVDPVNEPLPFPHNLENENTEGVVACQEYYCDEKPEVQRRAERQSVVDMKLIAHQLRDEISGAHARVMREVAQAANDQLAAIVTPSARPPPVQFHRKTGQVRMPRAIPESGWCSPARLNLLTCADYCSSDGEEYLAVESCEDVSFPAIEREICFSTPEYEQDSPKLKMTEVQKAPKAPKRKGPWIRTSTGDHAINPVKCPPCARQKKKDKCHGGPPCKECYRRGRIKAESCQEWGEGWEPEERGARNVLPGLEL